MTDIHSHILFGLDDGAETVDESVAMLRAAKKAGYYENCGQRPMSKTLVLTWQRLPARF